MLALWAVGVVAVFFEIFFVDPHLSRSSWRCGVCGEVSVNGKVLELDTFSFLPRLDVSWHRTYLCECLGIPPRTLVDPRHRPCTNQSSVFQADREGVVSSVVAHEHSFASLCADVAVRVVVRTFDRVLVQDIFADPDHGLPKCSSTYPLP